MAVFDGSTQLVVAIDKGVDSFGNYLKGNRSKMAQEKKVPLHLNGKEAPKHEKPAKSTVKLVPPDGGWGWIIILATSICLVSKLLILIES